MNKSAAVKRRRHKKDLKVVSERRKEPARSCAEFVKDLKKVGLT